MTHQTRSTTLSQTSVRVARPEDDRALVRLWEACALTRPWNNPARDIERRRAIDDGLFLVVCDESLATPDASSTSVDVKRHEHRDRLIASAMGGYDGHRGWVYYVAVHPDYQRRGLARALMDELEARLLALGCPKINLQVREDNAAALDFYEKLGFAVDRTVSLGKRLILDD